MKTALLTLGLAAVFLGIGLGVTKVVLPRLGGADAAADSTAADSAAPPPDVAPLQADVGRLRARLEAAEARADSLRRVVDGHRAHAEAAQTDATDLAKTLAKLEDEELGAVVQRLDGRSFVRLYGAASARNRARFLDALTPDQAAAFVRHQLPGGAAPVRSASAPADSAASTP